MYNEDFSYGNLISPRIIWYGDHESGLRFFSEHFCLSNLIPLFTMGSG